jgi:uncharacterized protein (DUF488 family)
MMHAAKMKQPLSTIGYEGRTIEELLDLLTAANVQLLIDVRAVAASRRPGFSKTALAGALKERGIDYLHLRPLGTPKSGREAARAGRVAEMRSIYEAHLESLEVQLALERLAVEAQGRHAALLCYELDVGHCHRAILAERLAQGGGFALRNL